MSTKPEKRMQKTAMPMAAMDSKRNFGSGRLKICIAASLKVRTISTGC